MKSIGEQSFQLGSPGQADSWRELAILTVCAPSISHSTTSALNHTRIVWGPFIRQNLTWPRQTDLPVHDIVQLSFFFVDFMCALYLEYMIKGFVSPDRGPVAAQPIAVSRPKSALCWSHAGSDHSRTHPSLSCLPLSLYCKNTGKDWRPIKWIQKSERTQMNSLI